jgi:hypothetical protein
MMRMNYAKDGKAVITGIIITTNLALFGILFFFTKIGVWVVEIHDTIQVLRVFFDFTIEMVVFLYAFLC